MGRFTQADTIVPYPNDPQSFNRYAYARNNPIRYIDPTGHSWWSTLLGAIAGIIAGVLTQNFAIGMAVFSAVNAGISAAQAGGNFLQAAGISIVAGVAGFYGGSLGGAWGEALGGSFGAAVLGGLVGGAASGAVRSALTGGDVVAGTLIGVGVGTGMGIMVGGLTYTSSKPADTQTTSAKGDNSATNTAIKSGDSQGATDSEVNSGNQPPVVSRKIAGDKIAQGAEKGGVGVGNNPTPSKDSFKQTRFKKVKYLSIKVEKKFLVEVFVPRRGSATIETPSTLESINEYYRHVPQNWVVTEGITEVLDIDIEAWGPAATFTRTEIKTWLYGPPK